MTVAQYTAALINQTGGTLMVNQACTILYPSLAAATLYTDITGGTTTGSNTATSTAQGNLTFFADPASSDGTGRYVIQVAGQVDVTVQLEPQDTNLVHKAGAETLTGLKNFAKATFAGQPHLDVTHPTFGADPTGVADSTAAFNNALAAAVAAGGAIVWVPVGVYLINGTITGMLSLQAAAKFGVALRGVSKFGTVLKKNNVAGNVIEISGYHNEVSNLTIDGNAKLATSGVIVRGYSASTTTYSSVRQLRLHDLYIKGCKEGVRFGHYSTLNGVTGDSGDADISDNYYRNIWVDTCDYGWIEDGQNIILNHSDNVMFTAITNNHILCPRGGQPNFKGAYFGQSLTNTVAKIDIGSSNGYFKDCRSECVAPNSPPVFQSGAGNGTSQVVMEGCVWTQPVGVTNVDVRARGGSLTMIQCNTNGIVELTNTDYVGLGNDIEGGYTRIGAQTSRSELIFDKVFLSASPGPAQITGPNGRVRIGTTGTVTATAYSPATALTVEGSANTLSLVGDANEAAILFFNAATALNLAQLYMYKVGTNGSLVSIQSKPDGGAIRDCIVADSTGTISLPNAATTTTAPGAGGGGALPATPVGYVTVVIGGVARKLPYY